MRPFRVIALVAAAASFVVGSPFRASADGDQPGVIVGAGNRVMAVGDYATSLALVRDSTHQIVLGESFNADGTVHNGNAVLRVFGQRASSPDNVWAGAFPLVEYRGGPENGFRLTPEAPTGAGTVGVGDAGMIADGTSISGSYAGNGATVGSTGSARFGVALLEYRDQPLGEALGVAWDNPLLVVGDDSYGKIAPWFNFLPMSRGGAAEFGPCAFPTSGVERPIDPDGSSKFKRDRTIPVKVEVNACDDRAVPQLTIHVSLTRDGAAASSSVTGMTMRFDAATGKYIYNLSTKSLAPGRYELRLSSPGMKTAAAMFEVVA